MEQIVGCRQALTRVLVALEMIQHVSTLFFSPFQPFSALLNTRDGYPVPYLGN